MEEPKKWYITRTASNELYVLQLPEEAHSKISQIDTTVFPVAFSSQREAQIAADFITRIVDKALATRPITILLDGKEIAAKIQTEARDVDD